MEAVIILFVLALVLAIVVHQHRTSQKQRHELQRENEEKTKRYIEEIQRVGEEYEKTGIPVIESEIALKRGETLHVILHGTQWMEYRKVRTGRVAGHGVTGRVKIAKGLYYRYGAGRMVSESIDTLKPIDSGDLYVTNKGLFFRGNIGNKNIPYGKIISILPFQNGLKIERDSGKDVYMPYNFLPCPEKAAAIALLWDKCVRMPAR